MTVLSFENIEHMVFNHLEPNRELELPEKAARGSLKHLLDEVSAGRLEKEKASLAKAELKKKYNACLKHAEFMELLKDRILKACWNFKQSDKYINSLTDDFGAIHDMPNTKEYSLYKGMAFTACEYFDDKLAEPQRWSAYRKEMDRLNYLVTSQRNGQQSIEEQSTLAEQRAKVMSDFMEYAFYRIGRGLPKMSEADTEFMLDMPSLWNRLLDLAEQGNGTEIENILEGLRLIYRQMIKTGGR